MSQQLPYFDFLLKLLANNHASVTQSFGQHVHWGYWSNPEHAICDDQDFAQAAEQLSKELWQLSSLQDGEDLLDVGCGFGGTLASLNQSFQNLKMSGLNIDSRQLQRAQQNLIPRAGNEISLTQADACKLPFADASFDRVLAVECIFHFPSREDFLQEAYRVLRHGGTLTLSDFIPAKTFLPLVRLSQLPWLKQFNYFGHCDVSCTLAKYHQLAKSAGLVVEESRNITLNILPTYRYLQHLLGETHAAANWLIKLLSKLGSSGLLSYYLIKFRKP